MQQQQYRQHPGSMQGQMGYQGQVNMPPQSMMGMHPQGQYVMGAGYAQGQQPMGMMPMQQPGMGMVNNQQQLQQSRTQQVRMYQLNQLYTYFPNIAMTAQSPTHEDHRLPLNLSRAKQPLYVRISIPSNFPMQAPQIFVMHRVVHTNISKDGNFMYIGKKLQNWNMHSNLMAVVRQMHSEFEIEPPVLESFAHGRQAASSMSSVNIDDNAVAEPQIDDGVHHEEIKQVVMRSEQERKEAAERAVDEETRQIVSDGKEQLQQAFQSLSMTELKRMKEDETYAEDQRMTSNGYVRLTKYKEEAEDKALELARDNIKQAEQLEGDIQVYNETVYPAYEENRQKAIQLIEQVNQLQQRFSRESAVKVLKGVANDKYKQSNKTQKAYTKGEISKDEFLEKYIKERKEFYMMDAYANIMRQAQEAGS